MFIGSLPSGRTVTKSIYCCVYPITGSSNIVPYSVHLIVLLASLLKLFFGQLLLFLSLFNCHPGWSGQVASLVIYSTCFFPEIMNCWWKEILFFCLWDVIAEIKQNWKVHWPCFILLVFLIMVPLQKWLLILYNNTCHNPAFHRGDFIFYIYTLLNHYVIWFFQLLRHTKKRH